MTILLINPPVAKPCEAPAGIARLAGTLRRRGLRCQLLDLNLHCLLAQFETEPKPTDTWSRRAFAKRREHLQALMSPALYRQPSRYRRAVEDLNRVLSLVSAATGCNLSLNNFEVAGRSPSASADLLKSAAQYEKNHFYSSFHRQLDEAINSLQPRFVGISFSYLSQALPGFAVLGHIRHRFPEIKTIIGGGLITSWMNSQSWNNPFKGLVDHCIKGPGEQALVRLLGAGNTEELGVVDYDDLSGMGYLAPGFILPYSASAGCYWRTCTFCPDRAEQSTYLAKKPATAIAELTQLVKRYEPSLIHLLDNAVSPSFLRHLAASPPGAPWYGFVRFEEELEQIDFCRALNRSGCVMLKLGLESGSQRVLDEMRKGIQLERVVRILANLRQAGIAAYIYLLFGTPHEDEQEAELTLEFVREYYRDIGFLNLAIFNMPVCSPEAHHCESRFSTDDLSLYCNFTHPRGWDRKSVRTFLQKRFRKDPRVAEILRRDPPSFTSNHAAFLCRP